MSTPPFDEPLPSASLKGVRVVALILFLYFIGSIAFLVSNALISSHTFFNGVSPFLFIALLAPFIGAVLLWQHKKSGWIISVIVITFYLIKKSYYEYLAWQDYYSDFDYSENVEIVFFFVVLILFSSLFWYLNQRRVADAFRIRRTLQIAVVGITTFLSLGLLFLL